MVFINKFAALYPSFILQKYKNKEWWYTYVNFRNSKTLIINCETILQYTSFIRFKYTKPENVNISALKQTGV